MSLASAYPISKPQQLNITNEQNGSNEQLYCNSGHNTPINRQLTNLHVNCDDWTIPSPHQNRNNDPRGPPEVFQSRSPSQDQPAYRYPHCDSFQSDETSILLGILQQVQLQQDFLKYQGKKGFRFRGNPDDYPALVTCYNEKTRNATADAKRFRILYTLLDGDAEIAYNRHISETNKSKALRGALHILENTFGYRNQNPLVNINERSAHAPVENMPKGFHTLLADISYCQDWASHQHETHLQNPSF